MTLTDSDIKKILADREIADHNSSVDHPRVISRDRLEQVADAVSEWCEDHQGDFKAGTLTRRQAADAVLSRLRRHPGEFGFIPVWALIAFKVVLLIIEIWLVSEGLENVA